MGGPRTVAFVCLHGSGKSLIAAEHFRQLASQRGLAVHSASAAPDPDLDVPPKVVEGLLKDGIDVRGYRPRRVTREELAAASHVVSFGCDFGDLAPPDLAVERWDDVPAVSEDLQAARHLILSRLPRLVTKFEVPPKRPSA